MSGFQIWGLLIFVFSIGTVGWSLAHAYVPAAWPMPRLYRSEHPIYYWLTLGGYCLGAIFALLFALS